MLNQWSGTLLTLLVFHPEVCELVHGPASWSQVPPSTIRRFARSVVLELDVMANLCTDGRRLLVILLSPAQQQLIRTYDVTSHYIIGMKCEHGRSCRDPEPSCLVLTVPSRPRDTQDPSHLSNKLPGWHRHRSCGAWRIPRVKEKTWWRRWNLTRTWMLELRHKTTELLGSV